MTFEITRKNKRLQISTLLLMAILGFSSISYAAGPPPAGVTQPSPKGKGCGDSEDNAISAAYIDGLNRANGVVDNGIKPLVDPAAGANAPLCGSVGVAAQICGSALGDLLKGIHIPGFKDPSKKICNSDLLSGVKKQIEDAVKAACAKPGETLAGIGANAAGVVNSAVSGTGLPVPSTAVLETSVSAQSSPGVISTGGTSSGQSTQPTQSGASQSSATSPKSVEKQPANSSPVPAILR